MSIKMWGNDGPLGYQTGYAPCFAALAGVASLVGYPGGPPLGTSMRYGDSTVGAAAAFAAVAALLHRDLTGEGQFVDVSAVETLSSMIGDCLLDQELTGVQLLPDGNRHADMAPHNCYPCSGGDWISIAVADDNAMASAVCRPRRRRRWSTTRGTPAWPTDSPTPTRSTSTSQSSRGATTPDSWRTNSGRPVCRPPKARRLWTSSAISCCGTASCTASSAITAKANDRFSQRRGGCQPWRPRSSRGAPDLGEHNDYVRNEILARSRDGGNMTTTLAGTVALVTGASSGIGAATARALSAPGRCRRAAGSSRRPARRTQSRHRIVGRHGASGVRRRDQTPTRSPPRCSAPSTSWDDSTPW